MLTSPLAAERLRELIADQGIDVDLKAVAADEPKLREMLKT